MVLFEGLVRQALAEDIGPGDLTTELTVPKGARCQARLVAKAHGVLSGMDVFRQVFEELSAGCTSWQSIENGNAFTSGTVIASFEGLTAPVLSGERVALNFVQHLSGIATATRAYVDAVKGFKAKIVDTRKTTPLLRALEKQAIRHGGGSNHRHALYDGILIKENHIAAAGGIDQAMAKAKASRHHLAKIEIEVQSLAELDQALAAGADVILLDNMDIATMAEAVRRAHGKDVLLEASGNMTLDRVRSVAETGVDIISVGALTHSVRAIDLSLLITHV